MTVLLVVALFAIVLFAEYLTSLRHPEVAKLAEKQPADLPRLQPSLVAGFKLADNVRYHPGHSWAMTEAPGVVRIGIDDFAARVAGSINAVTLPRTNSWVRQGQQVIRVRRDGREITMCSPIEGTVLSINPAILEKPSLITSDPYGEGWLMTVQAPDEKLNFRNLFGGSTARRWMEDCAGRLRTMLHAPATALAQDGGMFVSDFTATLSDEEWDKINGEFFLS